MNLVPYKTQIDTEVPALQQVVVATQGVTSIAVDTADLLQAAIAATVSGRMSPLALEQNPTYPNIVYHQVAAQPLTFGGYHATTTDTFILYIRAATYASLQTVVAAVDAAIEASAYSIEVMDRLEDYDDEQKVFRCNLEVAFTVAALPTQTLPAAMLYAISASANPSLTDGHCIRQREQQNWGVLLLTTAGNIETLRRAVQAALLGYQVSTAYEHVQYVDGAPLDGGGGLDLWAEGYSDALYISNQ